MNVIPWVRRGSELQPHEVVEELEDELLVVRHEAAAVDPREHRRQHVGRLCQVEPVAGRQTGRQELGLLPKSTEKFRIQNLFKTSVPSTCYICPGRVVAQNSNSAQKPVPFMVKSQVYSRSRHTHLLIVEMFVAVLERGLLEHVGPLAANGRRRLHAARREDEAVHVDPLHVRHPRAMREALGRQLHLLVELRKEFMICNCKLPKLEHNTGDPNLYLPCSKTCIGILIESLTLQNGKTSY